MTRWLLLACLVCVLWGGQHAYAQNLTFRVINGYEAKFLEKKINGFAFDTLLWGDRDTVLLLTYGPHDYVLNVEARSGTIASRLGI